MASPNTMTRSMGALSRGREITRIRSAVIHGMVLLAACCSAAQIKAGPVRLRIAPSDELIAPSQTLQFSAKRAFFSGQGLPGGELDITSAAGWTTSDPNVATIDRNGLATAKNVSGSKTITVTAVSGPFRATALLTVSSASLTSVTVTAPALSVPLGRSVQFSATGNYSDATHHDLTDAAVWSSASPAVATITQLGSAKTRSQGSSVISAVVAGKTGMATLTVTAPVLDEIVVTPSAPELIVPATQMFTATGFYSDGGSQDLTPQVVWNSSAPAIASINAAGLATAISPGITNIMASFKGVTGSDRLSIIALSSIAVTPADSSIVFGSGEQFSALGMYTDGSIRDLSSSVAWVSTNTAVATINSTGFAQSVLEGATNIQATMNGVTGATPLAVIDDVSISIAPTGAQVPAGSSQLFTVMLTGASNRSVTWSVNGVTGGNSVIGTVDSTGLYRAPASVPTPPNVTVAVTSQVQNRSASAAVTIGPPPYLPLAVGNTWSYNCSGPSNPTITDTVTATAMVNGVQTFALQFQFPNAPTQTFLLANDPQANTTLYGYLVNGNVQPVTPTLYIAANPTKGQVFNYPAQNGGTVPRFFVAFDVTNPTPLGVFNVAVYDENGTPAYGYHLGLGIAEQDHGPYDCVIASFHLN